MEKNPLEYKIGETTSAGKITKIYAATSTFLLYETDGRGNVAYITLQIDHHKLMAPMRTLLVEVFGLLSTKKERKKFSSRIALAFADCFNGSPDIGVEVLKKVKQSIIKSKKINSKLYYISTCICIVLFNLILTYLLNSYDFGIFNSDFIFLFTIATFGSLGGFLSISININKLDLDIDEGMNIQILTGFSRIFISMISSLIIFTFIKSNFLLGHINTIDNTIIFYAISVVSGFSETFVPNIIRNIENENSSIKE